MIMKHILLCRILLAVVMAFALGANAQDYPYKLIRIVVPYQPGATTDAVARLIGQELGKKWSQPVIVENQPGGSGVVGANRVSRSAPDGYTLMVTPGGLLTTAKLLDPTLVYDPDAFVPVSMISRVPLVTVVNPKTASHSLQEWIAFAKANPDRINYASQGVGTTAHLTAELMKSMAGIKMSHVPYKGSFPAITDLLGGQVDVMMCVDFSTALPLIRAGKLRALATCDETRNPALPDVPTISEVLPGFLGSGWNAMVAPPLTPPVIANKLSTAIAEILKTSGVKERLATMNLDTVGSSPGEMALYIAQEKERWGKVIRDNRITAE